MSSMSNTPYFYTSPAGRMPSRALTIVCEPDGSLFLSAKLGEMGAFIDIPRAHKLRLYEWLKADIEGEAAETAAARAGRVVVLPQQAGVSPASLHVVRTETGLGFAGVLAPPAIERAAALGQSPMPAYVTGRDMGDEDQPVPTAKEGVA
jgi:hypothetical protein